MIDVIKLQLKNKKMLLKSEGSSMLPIIKPNDLIYLKKIDIINIEINDIVLIKKRKKYLIHRVIYKNKSYLITKGDNNYTSDGRIYPNQIIAKVYQIKRENIIFNPYEINLFQSTLYLKEIYRILNNFEELEVNFVFLKGLPLHLFFEKTHPKIIFSDCDILVDKKDLSKIDKLFKNLGYRKRLVPLFSFDKFSKIQPAEFTYYRKINGFPILFDIHLQPLFLMKQIITVDEIYPTIFLDSLTYEFLSNKKNIKIFKTYFPILSVENLIIYLSLHFFHHNLRGIYKLELIDKIIRKEFWKKEKWEKMPEEINYFKVQNFVYPVFMMLKKYFDTPLPRRFLSSIRPEKDKLRYIRKNIMKINVFDDEPRVQAGINRFRNIFYLSPNPLAVKLLVFLNPQVFYSIIWVIYRKFILRFSFLNSLLRSGKISELF